MRRALAGLHTLVSQKCGMKFPHLNTSLPRETQRRGIGMSSPGADWNNGPGWTRGEPCQQSYFEFVDGAWGPRDPLSSQKANTSSSSELGRFSILSWNIDMKRKLEYQRMKAALSHLRTHVDGKAEPAVIMLNEMTGTNLELMKLTDWIQRDYYMSDITRKNWESIGYGE